MPDVRVLFEAEHHRLVLTGLDALAPIDPPRVDVSKLPSADVVARTAFQGDGTRALAGCVRAPSSRYVHGLEQTLFEKASWLMLSTAEVQVKELTLVRSGGGPAAPSVALEGRDQRGALRVEHTLSFVGPERDALLCSLVCSGDRCGSAHLVLEGEPPLPPPPGLVARLVTSALESPRSAGALGAGLALALMVVVLWRRPFPRP